MSQRFTPRHADPTPPIRLLLLPDAADPYGTPRAALLLADPRPGRRYVLRAFGVDEFRPLVRNTLRGFARVRLLEGMMLPDVAVHVRDGDGDGKAWGGQSGKPMIGCDGAAMKDAAGKVQYTPLMTFLTRADQDTFSNAVIDVLRASYPEVLT